MLDTLKIALKAVYLSLGGNADTIRDKNDLNSILLAITDLGIGAQISGAASALPKVTTDDNGKILTVVSGKWAAAAAPVELPAVTGDDDNKILTVVDGAWAAGAAPTELPAVTGDDDNKVLTVVSGAWAAANLPS